MKSLTIFCFLFLSCIAIAQDPIDLSLRHSMKQDGLSMLFTVLDSDKKGIKHHQPDKIYYWYKAQRVLGTQGGSSGQLLHGLFESFYGNKQLCEKGTYCKGLKDGEWNHWRTDGTLISKEHWSNGRQHGTQLYYDEQGEIYKTTIIRGKKATTNSGDSLIEISGNNHQVTVFDSLGRKLSVARYKKELLHGKQETFNGDEKTVTVYKEGELVPAKEKKQKQEQNVNESGTEGQKEGFFTRLKKRFSKKDKAGQPESDLPAGQAGSKDPPTDKPGKKRKKETTDQPENSSEKKILPAGKAGKKPLFKRKST